MMRDKICFFLITLTLVLAPFFGGASEVNEHGADSVSLRDEIKQDILHHLQDAHDFHLFTDEETGTHVSMPLPIILLDDGLQVFMSSAFHHGESVAESNGNFYFLHHNHIYKTDAEGTLNYDDNHHITNASPLDFSITKSVFSVIVFSLILFLLFKALGDSYKNGLVARGIGKFLEPLVIFVRDEIAVPNIGKKHYRKYMSYLLTVFVFIWFINLAGLTPLGINVTGNIAVTFALAIMTFLITQLTAKGYYWKHIFWMPGVPVPMKIILAPIELLGVFIKPFALMIRLYANISAGHIVLMSLIGLLFIFNNWFARGAFLGLTLFLSIIELLVAFLQAYIFTMLTALYFGFAVEEHDEHH
jgi:F-type H+-transporting ATPase subunit a